MHTIYTLICSMYQLRPKVSNVFNLEFKIQLDLVVLNYHVIDGTSIVNSG